ncbi:LysM peptidoglycan-binding domain-containing protein [Oceanirhabdus seepicola]|uniref:LysM peptidoglycan-binding domain-containing protein n=1 Tax=Oceanirhabdus seepicola TaxID=2828781 RepID=A0A9J6NZ95_9CLOT|nr:LysM peptidoglycan-binding domain-containing protein [Oceanirhabdus seepicola]MCM1989396.1 LysM peptidoglycan-binding domain-containing protein [Oceanirhabdus seepicola]
MKKAITATLALGILFSASTTAFANDEYYTVKKGDVLWKIARKYDTTWEKLAEINKLDNPHLIFPDQKIKVSINEEASKEISKEESKKELSNSEKVVAVLNSIETGDSEAIAYINPEKYIQHNLSAGDGLEGFGQLLSMLPPGSSSVDVVRVFEDGDYVITQTDYNFFGPKVGFDIFRFEDGLIVEHWDNLAEKIVEPNPSGRTQLDGVTEVVELDKTEENKALVKDFVETVLMAGKFDVMGEYFDGDNYIQHNTQIADGLSGLGQAMAAMAEQEIYMVYEENHMILGQGNFVLSVSEGTFGGQKVAYYDLFRVENGKIAEHWDVIENILNKEEWKNDNGKF